MFKEKGKVSIVNKILIVMLAIITVFAVVLILMTQLNKKSIETHVKATQGMIQNYATTEGNTWDISKNSDGSVIATLSEDGTLTISGKGEMKYWNPIDTTDWHDSSIRKMVKNVVIHKEVAKISDYAFYKCSNLINITIPNSVTWIGNHAFEGCSKLASIDMPKSIVMICWEAFKGCTSLTSLKIPEGSKSTGWEAFEGCTSLTNVDIPEGVTEISEGSFKGCTSLINVEIPTSVTRIEEEAFYKCTSLTKIKIPGSVTKIENDVFTECSSLKEIDVDENNTKYMDDNGVLYTKNKIEIVRYPENKARVQYTILEGVTSIAEGAFYGCSNLTNINIPEGVTSIGKRAFYYCRSLTSINIPEGVVNIEDYAFYECRSLTSINIPEGVTSIGNSVFTYCRSLKSIKIPSSVTNIEKGTFSGCFSGCSSLVEIDVHKNNKNYMDDNGILYTKDKTEIIRYPEGKENVEYTILDGVTTIDAYAFSQCDNLIDIEFPSSVINIGEFAFSNCHSLIKVEIPSSLTNIGMNAFMSCNSLKEIENLENVINIESCAFSGCESLYSIGQLNEKATIGTSAFSYCCNLTNIEIPSTVTSIKEGAFNFCKIKRLISKGEEVKLPNILQRTQNQEDVMYSSKELSLTNCAIEEQKIVIDENKTYAKIEVKDGILKGLAYVIFYKEWDISRNGDRTVIATLSDDGTLNISGAGNMRNWNADGNWSDWHYTDMKEKITNVIINNGVTNIGEHAFFNCDNLKYITIPSSVTSIGNYAFNGCRSLIEIKLDENNPQYMDDNGILYTKNKTEIIRYPEGKKETEYKIPKELRTIRCQAFYGCSNLMSIEIPSTVILIEEYAFSKCSNLVEIKVDDENIMYSDEMGVLYSKDKTEIIRYPEGKKDSTYLISSDVTSISVDAFSGCDKLIILCYSGSTAETYAIKNNINYQLIHLSSTEREIDELSLLIIGIQPNTTVEELNKSIQSDINYEVIDIEGNALTNIEIIETAYGLKLENGRIYKLIVCGDTNGDGQANIKDILVINKHRLNKIDLENEYLLAGDINEDGDSDLKDILQINKYRLGKISEL